MGRSIQTAFLVFFYTVSALTECTYLINKVLNACSRRILSLRASRLDPSKTEKMHLPPWSTLAFVQHMSLLGLITSSQHSTHPRFLFSQLKSTGLSPVFYPLGSVLLPDRMINTSKLHLANTSSGAEDTNLPVSGGIVKSWAELWTSNWVKKVLLMDRHIYTHPHTGICWEADEILDMKLIQHCAHTSMTCN